MALIEKDSEAGDTELLRVRLTGTSTKRAVVFKVTPDVVENRTVNYKSMDPIHAPGQFYVYQSTASRAFSLGAVRVVSRTSKEATENLRMLNVLRAWTMPQFGLHGRSDQVSADEQNQFAPGTRSLERYVDYYTDTNVLPLGSPPEILWLSAYSNRNKQGNIYRVPVVLTQLSIPYPSDVDYIPTAADDANGIAEGIPFPTIMTLDMNMMETRSPSQLTKFSLADFRRGRLTAFGDE